MEQQVVKTLWDAFSLFWRTRDRFRNIHHRFRQKEGQLRKRMRSEAFLALLEEIGAEELGSLRDEFLAPALEKIRSVPSDIVPVIISSIASNLSIIYHRISLLLEHYMGLKEGRGRESADESRSAFLRYMEEINRLIRASERLFEKLASALRHESLFIRSLYIHWNTISSDRDVLRTIYKKMYEGGMCEALLEVAEDFLRSGFYMRAREVAEKALSRIRLIKKGVQRERLEERAKSLLAESERTLARTLGAE